MLGLSYWERYNEYQGWTGWDNDAAVWFLMPDKLPCIKGLGYSVFMSVTQASLRTVLQAIKKQKERKQKKESIQWQFIYQIWDYYSSYLAVYFTMVYFSLQGKNEPRLVFLPLGYLLQLSDEHIHFFSFPMRTSNTFQRLSVRRNQMNLNVLIKLKLIISYLFYQWAKLLPPTV